MDHEVEDNVDVESARSKDAEAVCLKEHGAIEPRLDGDDSGIKAFQVAHGENAVVLLRESKQISGMRRVGGDGFFDEQIDACGEQRRSYFVMA